MQRVATRFEISKRKYDGLQLDLKFQNENAASGKSIENSENENATSGNAI